MFGSEWTVYLAMAIYHLSLKVGSRIGGQSAVAKADYIEREGKYAKDAEEVEYRESENMPGWAEDDPRKYWAAADEHERANGRLFVQVEVALPVELDQEQRRDLARSFAQELTGSERLPYTMAIHRGESQKPGKPDNPHVHLMISERGLDGHDRNAATWFKRVNAQDPEKGGAKKTSLSSKEWLADTRQRWETAANRALERAGSAERIDHRSLAAQREEAIQRGQLERAAELNRIPRNVPGPEIHRAERGGPSRVLEIAKRIERSNAEARAERAEANTQVDRAALVVQERRDVLTARLQAIDKEIRATRLAAVKEAGRRAIAQVAKTVQAGAKWISAIPERRQERRLQAEREAVWAARREQSMREAAERIAKREGEPKAGNQRNGPMRLQELTEEEKEQRWQDVRRQSVAAFEERQKHQEKIDTYGEAAFKDSLDPNTAKEQTRGESELGKEWKEQNEYRAEWIEQKYKQAHPKQSRQPKPQRGPERDSGSRGRW